MGSAARRRSRHAAKSASSRLALMPARSNSAVPTRPPPRARGRCSTRNWPSCSGPPRCWPSSLRWPWRCTGARCCASRPRPLPGAGRPSGAAGAGPGGCGYGSPPAAPAPRRLPGIPPRGRGRAGRNRSRCPPRGHGRLVRSWRRGRGRAPAGKSCRCGDALSGPHRSGDWHAAGVVAVWSTRMAGPGPADVAWTEGGG